MKIIFMILIAIIICLIWNCLKIGSDNNGRKRRNKTRATRRCNDTI